MTQEQLQKANQLNEKRKEITKILRTLTTDSSAAIGIVQQMPSGTDNLALYAGKDSDTEIGRSVRVVLEATKQTIKSLYEREREKIENEFKSL